MTRGAKIALVGLGAAAVGVALLYRRASASASSRTPVGFTEPVTITGQEKPRTTQTVAVSATPTKRAGAAGATKRNHR